MLKNWKDRKFRNKKLKAIASNYKKIYNKFTNVYTLQT